VVQLLRAPTNSCTLTSWKDVAPDCSATPMGDRCVENLALASVSGSQRKISIREEQVDGSNNKSYSPVGRALCFQPSGVMMYGSGTSLELAADPKKLLGEGAGVTGGGFVFSLVDGDGGPNSSNKAQRVHRLLIPMGGSARSLR
jgi:hypothetical protein